MRRRTMMTNPKLKYARLTQHLGGVYRNGDATSSFLVGGDKMVHAVDFSRWYELANYFSRLLGRITGISYGTIRPAKRVWSNILH